MIRRALIVRFEDLRFPSRYMYNTRDGFVLSQARVEQDPSTIVIQRATAH